MPTYNYEILITNLKKREKFFKSYDLTIRDLQDHGFFEAAVIHKKNRKRIYEEVSSLD